MERLGLGYEQLSASNPRLVYATVSGFGQTGPHASRPAFDSLLQVRPPRARRHVPGVRRGRGAKTATAHIDIRIGGCRR